MTRIEQISKRFIRNGIQSSSSENHVMIFHYDISTLKMFAEIFRKFGYLVTVFDDISKALLRLSQVDFDFVFTDLDMPQVHGYLLANQIKSQNTKTKIIMMTCRCQAEIADLMTMDTVDCWLFKPFNPKVLGTLLVDIDQEPKLAAYQGQA